MYITQLKNGKVKIELKNLPQTFHAFYSLHSTKIFSLSCNCKSIYVFISRTIYRKKKCYSSQSTA